MKKNDILMAFDEVIENTALWDEMSNIIFSLGGEIFETKFGNSLLLHQKLVWRLIVDYRGYPDDPEGIEFYAFESVVSNLSQNEPVEYDDLNGQHQILTDREQILDIFLSPDFTLVEILSIKDFVY